VNGFRAPSRRGCVPAARAHALSRMRTYRPARESCHRLYDRSALAFSEPFQLGTLLQERSGPGGAPFLSLSTRHRRAKGTRDTREEDAHNTARAHQEVRSPEECAARFVVHCNASAGSLPRLTLSQSRHREDHPAARVSVL
jgi:hypothetical protein